MFLDIVTILGFILFRRSLPTLAFRFDLVLYPLRSLIGAVSQHSTWIIKGHVNLKANEVLPSVN